MKNWLKDHDNRISFTVLYVGLSIFLSIYISIFWLIPIAFTHMLLEIIVSEGNLKQRLLHSILHIKLDIVLIIFALWLSVYFEAIFGLLGLGATTRAVAQGGTRFIIWQKAIRGFLMSIDDVAQLTRGVLRAKANKSSKKDEIEESSKLTKIDFITIFIGVVLFLAIFFAPFIIDISYKDLFDNLANELKPY